MAFYPVPEDSNNMEDENPFADLRSNNTTTNSITLPDYSDFTTQEQEHEQSHASLGFHQSLPDLTTFTPPKEDTFQFEQQPFEDLIESSSHFNYHANHSPTEQTQEEPTPPPLEEEAEEEEPPNEPQTPLFRPFGVSATLTSSSNTTDQPLSPSHPAPSSRPALPDILGGGTPSGSLLLPDSRTALPAFKKSSPKVSQTNNNNNNNNNNHTSNQSPRQAASQSTTQAKPYRPLGLKIPQPKPITIQPPSTTESNQTQKTLQVQSNQSPPQIATTDDKKPVADSDRPNTQTTAHEAPSHQSNNSDHLDQQEPQSPQKYPTSDPISPLKESGEKHEQVPDAPTSPTENASAQDQPASQENKNRLSIVVPPTSSSLPALSLDQPQVTQPSTSLDQPHQENGPSNREAKPDQSAVPGTNPPDQPVQTSLPESVPKPTHHTDSDSEDERPLASVREGLVQQQQQQQQQQQGRTPPRVNASVLPSVPNPPHYPAPPLPLYKCSVGDPQKMGMINDIHTVYTVKTTATDPNSSGPLKASSTVLRRFRDFVWLFDALVSNNPGIIVPPIPDKNLRHRFQEGFIAARRVALEFFLQKTVNHPMLTSDPDLKLFLESDAFGLEIKHRKHDSSHQTGWLANIAGPRFVETDEFFENRKIGLDTLEGQLKVLQSSLAAASKARRAMAQSLSELAEALQVLSTSDLSKPVRNTIERLAGLHRQAHQWALDQATNELESLITTVEAYARLTNSVRLTFNGRVKSWDKLQSALNHLRKVQANHEKIKRSCAPSDQSTALMYSLAELEEAERKTHDARNEFADVSKLIKAEFQRFDQEKVEDFKLSICAFVDGLTDRQRQIVKVWQEYYQVLQHLSKQNADASSVPNHPNNGTNNTNTGGSSNTNANDQNNDNSGNHIGGSDNKNTDNIGNHIHHSSDDSHDNNSGEAGQAVTAQPTSAHSISSSTGIVSQEPEPSSSKLPDTVSSPVEPGMGEQKGGHDGHDDSRDPSDQLPQDHQPLLLPDDAAVWADHASPPSPAPLSPHHPVPHLPAYEQDIH